MRRAVWMVLVSTVVGCGSSSVTPSPSSSSENAEADDASKNAPPPSKEETRAVGRLAKETGVAWRIAKSTGGTFLSASHRDAGNPVLQRATLPSHVAIDTEIEGADLTAVTVPTLAFLGDHRDVFRMREPQAELVPTRSMRDALDMVHVRFSQVERGIPVVGGGLYVHYDGTGRVTAMSGLYVPGLDALDATPSISAEHAGSIAAGPNQKVTSARLVFFADNEATARALAWELQVDSTERAWTWTVHVDAKSGAILSNIDKTMTIEGSGVGVKGDRKKIEISPAPAERPGVFFMQDKSRTGEIFTFDGKNSLDLTVARIFESTSTTSWDTGRAGAGSAVDASAQMGFVYDYYKKAHNRKGIDDKDTRIQQVVHYGEGHDNASYNGNSIMLYGDGKEIFEPLAGALDVMAHEFTHGFTDFSSKLVYKNQSGAVNEAISDIFGAIIEHASKPDAKNNWLIGEGFVKEGGALRDMVEPGAVKHKQPSHMQQFVKTTQDNGGVHINSGIVNKAAQLMTVGGTHSLSKVKVDGGIGWDKLAQVWYRTNSMYLTESSDFAATAKGTLQAATDLKLTKAEIDTIDCAWKAVGVVQGACVAPLPPPAPTEPAKTDGGAKPDNAPGDDAVEKDPAPTPGEIEITGDEEEDAEEKGETKERNHGASKQTVVTRGCATTMTSSGAAGTDTSLVALLAVALATTARRRRTAR